MMIKNRGFTIFIDLFQIRILKLVKNDMSTEKLLVYYSPDGADILA